MTQYRLLMALTVIGLMAVSDRASALVELCDMSTEASILSCVKLKTSEIDEANLPNEYFVENTKIAREDMLMLLDREVVSHEPGISKATHFGFVVQYEDEPRFHYFCIGSDGLFTMLFEQNTIDLKGDFPAVKDLATFVLHAGALSQSLRESLEYAYQDENGLAVSCDISQERGVTKHYSRILKADESSANVKRIAVDKISDDVRRCAGEVDIAFELGDGYYDVQWHDWFVVYAQDGKSVDGYLARFGVTYTEANDPSQVDEVFVRFNHLGQRISKVGDY